MNVIKFTPIKFTVLLVASVASVAAALLLQDRSAESQTRLDLPSSVRFQEAVGQDNGALTAELYLTNSAVPTHRTDRRGTSPQGPSIFRHHYDLRVAR